MLFVGCAACELAALWIDVPPCDFRRDLGSSRKPSLACYLDERAGCIHCFRRIADDRWLEHCTSAFPTWFESQRAGSVPA